MGKSKNDAKKPAEVSAGICPNIYCLCSVTMKKTPARPSASTPQARPQKCAACGRSCPQIPHADSAGPARHSSATQEQYKKNRIAELHSPPFHRRPGSRHEAPPAAPVEEQAAFKLNLPKLPLMPTGAPDAIAPPVDEETEDHFCLAPLCSPVPTATLPCVAEYPVSTDRASKLRITFVYSESAPRTNAPMMGI